MKDFVKNNLGNVAEYLDSKSSLRTGIIVGYANDEPYIILGYEDNEGCVKEFNEERITILKQCQTYRFLRPDKVLRVQTDSDPMDDWAELMEKRGDNDPWAYMFSSICLRELVRHHFERPENLEELQDKCLSSVDYDAKHNVKEAKDFTKNTNLDEYGILDSVKEKWYKKWKR